MRQVKRWVLVAVALTFCGFIPQQAFAQCGVASWYGPNFHGRLTANGERYNMHGVSAAHKGLRFGTKVRVTHQKTGRSIVVRIKDRGPFVKGRIIDLSARARTMLGMGGLAPVCLAVISHGDGRYAGSAKRTRTASRKVKRVAVKKRAVTKAARRKSPKRVRQACLRGSAPGV